MELPLQHKVLIHLKMEQHPMSLRELPHLRLFMQMQAQIGGFLLEEQTPLHKQFRL